MSSRKLRVGIALESLEVPAWQFAILESIAKSDCAAIVALILPQVAPDTFAPGAVYKAFKRFEDKNRRTGADACLLTSAADLLQTVERITLGPTAKGQVNPAVVQEIRAQEFDVLLALVEPAEIPLDESLARDGVWHFEVEGRPLLPADGSLVGFPELIQLRSHISTSLQVSWAGDPAQLTAFHTCSAIDLLSHEVTRSEHLWKCSTFVLRSLRRCHEMGGEEFVRSLPAAPESSKRADASPFRVFSGIGLRLGFLQYLLWRVRKKVSRMLYDERWILLFGSSGRKPALSEFTKLIPPAGRFWADPHVVAKDGAHYVYFEDASQQDGLGHISMMSDEGDGRFTVPKPIIRRPYHLSYPFVFEWRGDRYLIPESAGNRTIELFRCVRFPDEWVFQHCLMEDIAAYDSTLVEYQGRWWMFAGVRAREGASTWDELCIFHAESPLSRTWQPHMRNPVISDVRRARPAGPLFFEGNRLYRPSQDSSGRYGRALNINQVLELDELHYKEVQVDRIEPWNRSTLAVHSYSQSGAMTFIDAIHREPKFRGKTSQ